MKRRKRGSISPITAKRPTTTRKAGRGPATGLFSNGHLRVPVFFGEDPRSRLPSRRRRFVRKYAPFCKDLLMKMEYVISSWDIPSLPIVGSNARFPVRRIFCVGRNYVEH